MSDPCHFEHCEVRIGRRQLLVQGQLVPLGARAFDVLVMLVQHDDRVVLKGELLDQVWSDLVVEENNLAVQISALRKVLGPHAIATIPGRGYRWTLPALDASDQAKVTKQAPADPLEGVPARGRSAHTLSRRAAPLIGRDAEFAILSSLVGQQRLVTLVGPGGVGKTALAARLAQAVSDSRPDGVAWVELSNLTDPALIPGALAQALDLHLVWAGDPFDVLAAALMPMSFLLVLDNAEHLLQGVAPWIEALLKRVPGVSVLVTSQAPLRLANEHVQRLRSLDVPTAGTPLTHAELSGAVTLFVARARSADSRFQLTHANVAKVIDICARLDGLPLALELAAARVGLLGLHGVAQRLDDRFRLLSGGPRDASPRLQGLQAALDWSVSLLPAAERELFQSLGVFRGGFSLALVCATLLGESEDEWPLIDRLAVLADYSLIEVDPADPPRYTLSESARSHAWDRAGTAQARLRERHAKAVRQCLEAAPDDWLHMPDHDWLARYEPELDNLRAALPWALANDMETLVALVGAAAPLWHHLSLDDEARRWHEQSEALLTQAALPKPLRARWWRAAQWAWAPTAPLRAHQAAEQAHALYRELGDVHGLYAQLTGLAGLWTEPHPQAEQALREALALEQPHWPARERAWGQRARADVARAHGRLQESREARLNEQALRVAAGDERGQWQAQLQLLDLCLAMDRVEEAVGLGRELVTALSARRAPRVLCRALLALFHALLVQGSMDEAAAMARQVSGAACDHGLLWMVADDLAWLAAHHQRLDAAAMLLAWSDAAHLARNEVPAATAVLARERARTAMVSSGHTDALGHALPPGALPDARKVVEMAMTWA